MNHVEPFSFGLNCALGPDLLRQYVDEISQIAECFVSAHPDACLPNEFGEYDMESDEMAAHIKEWAKSGLLNIVDGCCGSTPKHIAAIADAVKNYTPCKIVKREVKMCLVRFRTFCSLGVCGEY